MIDNNIVDIGHYDQDARGTHLIEEDTEDVNDTDEPEGEDINDDSFPDCDLEEMYCQEVGNFEENTGGAMDIDDGEVVDENAVHGMLKSPPKLVTTAVTPTKFLPVNDGHDDSILSKTTMDPPIRDIVRNSVQNISQPVFNVDEKTSTHDYTIEYKDTSQSDVSTVKPIRSYSYLTLNLQDAWDSGIIARQDKPLSHSGRKTFLHIRPTLLCCECCYQGEGEFKTIDNGSR